MPAIIMASGQVIKCNTQKVNGEPKPISYAQLKEKVAARGSEPWIEVYNSDASVDNDAVLVNLNQVESIEPDPA